jgi:hypothetical protein
MMLVGLLTIALASSAGSWAQSNAAAAQATAPAAEAPRGTGEGIKVYGQWTIEIRNRDGSVARHVEFENALSATGPGALAGLLSGNLVPGSWGLIIGGTSSPCSSGKTLGGCAIVQAASGQTKYRLFSPCATTVGPVQQGSKQPFCYATLEPSLTGTGGLYGYSSFTLSGEAYADTSATITNVQSGFGTCGIASKQVSLNYESPGACFAIPNFLLLTQYDFGLAGSCGGSGKALCPISVQAGQVIAATVTFSFSSPSGDGQAARVARTNATLRDPDPTMPASSVPVNH